MSVEIGHLFVSRALMTDMESNPKFEEFVRNSVVRHRQCDWGDVSKDSAELNNVALEGGGRLFSLYNISPDFKLDEEAIWVDTDDSRTLTTVMYPSDY